MSTFSTPLSIALCVSALPFILLHAYRFYYRKGWLCYAKTLANEAILKKCPSIVKRTFLPTIYLCHGLLQTLAAGILPPQVKNDQFIINDVKMPGGGHTSLAWAQHDNKYQSIKQSKVLVVIIPGLTGSVKDNYIRDLAANMAKAGYRVVVFQPRFNGGKFVLPDEGNLDIIKDFKITIDTIREKEKDVKLIGIGHSYGANMLVNYLGLHPEDNGFIAAVSIANPYNFMLGEAKLRNSITDRFLTKFLQRTADGSREELAKVKRLKLNMEDIMSFKNIREFDKEFTIKVYGFETVNDYYWAFSSCRQINHVKVPLLLLQAEDDPIVEGRGFDRNEIEKHSPNVILLMTQFGGHQGWVEGFFFLRRWYIKPCLEYVNAIVDLAEL